MTTIEESIKYLSILVAELYFVKRDYKRLMSYLAENITWIGTGKNEICLNKEEAILFFEKEVEVFDGSFELTDEWIECKQITPEVCCVMAVVKIQLDDTALLPFDTLRFSVVWRKGSDEQWKIIHLHNSVADGGIGEETYFNLSIAQSNYEVINETIKKASNTDDLTHINNATGFEQEVDQLLKKSKDSKYALVKFGIKNFRFINRRYSFEVGDEVLKNIAKNLEYSLNGNETCGRIEKDNFAMLYQYKDEEEFEKRLMLVRETLVDKFLYNKLDFEINLKAGVYLIKNNHETTKEILDKALVAMQSITHISQMNKPIYYEEGMVEKQYFNSKVLEEAPKAIEKDEFELYIQPQFDIQTGKIISGEALTRWKLPSGDLRMPNIFIPMFEEYGMILTFDFYMLDKLCKQMRKWIDEGISLCSISINQSRLHIKEKNYLKDFCSIVDQYKIPHHFIIFELTESAFIEDSERMISLAKELREEGFQLAIDDFGTGYASINLLAEITADILKLDRVLLKNCHCNIRLQKITEMIIQLTHTLNMRVVAEGIEAEEQLVFLKKIRCDIGQGFLVGKPIEAEKFIHLINEQN